MEKAFQEIQSLQELYDQWVHTVCLKIQYCNITGLLLHQYHLTTLWDARGIMSFQIKKDLQKVI